MSFNKTIARISLATAASVVFGGIYYNPSLNPLASVWMHDNYPSGSKNSPDVSVYVLTLICNLVLATCINVYVSKRQINSAMLLQMALELCLMVSCIQLPHALFAGHSLHGFAIDQLHNCLLVLIHTFILGFERFPEQEEKEE